jgi:hypothetical protein
MTCAFAKPSELDRGQRRLAVTAGAWRLYPATASAESSDASGERLSQTRTWRRRKRQRGSLGIVPKKKRPRPRAMVAGDIRVSAV